MEVYVLVNKKKGVLNYILESVVLVLAIASLLLSCLIPYVIIAVVLLGIAFYCVHFLTNIEYEYAYFGGEVKIARITNKSRRKRLMTIDMEEVLTIAPHGDRSVSRYEGDNSVVVKDFTSHDKNVEFYEMIATTGGKTHLIMFEPDEAFLKEICARYGSKVVRRPQ